jgi:hypothetical protein
MSIAYIAIKSCNTFWESAVEEIILVGNQNEKHLYLSLLILKHIALEFDQHMFDKRSQTVIEQYLRANLGATLGFIN